MVQILLDWATADVRLVLRIYFNVVLAALALLGDQCCKTRSHLRLLRGEKLDVIQTTGWLRGPSAIYLMFKLRRSPAGWLGLIMLLASVLWLAADLIVTGFVVSVTVVERCHFNTTSTSSYMVSLTESTIPANTKIGPFAPSNIGTLWDIIKTATANSQRNGGLTGVFRKANTDPMFRADDNDIIIGWQCETGGSDLPYTNDTDPQYIINDLIHHDLLYPNYSAQRTSYIGGHYLQLAIWSSSIGDWDDELVGLTTDEILNTQILRPCDVRAALDLSQKSSDARSMRPYRCFLNNTSMDFVLGKIQARTTLDEFTGIMRANVYGYFTDSVALPRNPANALASALDSILMMASAYQAGVNTPPPLIEDQYQGCLKQKANIPEAAIIIFVAVTGVTTSIFFYWVVLLRLVHSCKTRDSGQDCVIIEQTPNGLLGWMMQAVRGTSVGIEAHMLKEWALRPSAATQRLELRQYGRDVYEHVQHVPIGSANLGDK